jgi:hypothetical protein
MAIVILGDPSVALARIVNAVDAGTLTVADADPLPTNTNADLLEAFRSETTRTALFDDTAIISASTDGVVVDDVAAVAVFLVAAAGVTAAPSSRRAPSAPRPKAPETTRSEDP